MGRRRVMHIVVAGDIGGAERLLVDLASRPVETDADHEVALMTPNRALASYFASAQLVTHDRGPVHENPLAYLVRSLGPRDVAWVEGLLRSRAIDIVHTHTFGSHVLGTRAALRARRPQLRTEHHVMHYFDPSCSVFTRWAAERTERLAAVSGYVARVLAATAPALALKCEVIRNAVDTAYWSPRGGTDGEFRVAVVCRLTAWKRVHLAIEAAVSADVELWIVGDGEERPRLEALARERGGKVRFVGHQSDPRPFIAQCDAVVSSADKEPLGLSILEALSMAKPVIAFDGGGVPEIVAAGLTGLLAREPTGLAPLLARAKREREALRQMGEAGRQFVLRECSVERMCARYAQMYRALSPGGR